MHIDVAALPNDVPTLQRMVRTLAAERTTLTQAQAEIERLRLIVRGHAQSFGEDAGAEDPRLHRPAS